MSLTHKKSGFTVIELVIVMAIAAIVLSIAIPNFFGWSPEKRMQRAVHDIQGALNAARLAAVKENTDATIVFDMDNDSYTVSANGRTVRSDEMPNGIVLTSVTDLGTMTASATGTKQVDFNSRGLANPSVDIRVGGNANATPHRIRLNLSGSSKIFQD